MKSAGASRDMYYEHAAEPPDDAFLRTIFADTVPLSKLKGQRWTKESMFEARQEVSMSHWRHLMKKGNVGFFFTGTGRIGAKEGDLIHLLLSGKVPILFRLHHNGYYCSCILRY